MIWLLLSIVIGATVASDLLQSYEMKRIGTARVTSLNTNLILSIACLAVSFFTFMALVQIAPLSFAVPASAGSFIVETVLAKLILKEQIGVRRSAGALVVLAGIILLAR